MGWTCGDEQAYADLRHSELQKPKIIKCAKMTAVVRNVRSLPFSNTLSETNLHGQAVRMQGPYTPLVYLHPGCGSLHVARAVVLCSVEMMLSPLPRLKISRDSGTRWSTDVRSLVASLGERHAKRLAFRNDASDWFEVGFTNLIEALMGALLFLS